VSLTSKGFQSDVVINVTVDEAGKITAIEINSANETPGFGTRCAEDEAFLAQFIGKTLPLTETVDVLSGATVTSNAVITALQSAALETAEEAATATDLPDEATATDLVEVPVTEPRTGEGKAQGFQSEVTVTVTLDADDVITAVVINAANETPGFGTRCGEDEAFLAQFVGKTWPLEGIDVLSGATVTSNAVLKAVNAAFPAAGEAVTE
ncbi:MAG: FMN-binding protein, partial [Clostridia bacterium]|nr:FMN-binding protein [Clostridia bacterium]